ncbi:MAG: hypothetical protein C5S48_04165 [Candidatus Methanogaster sp.]|nr:MAG: hypothetical protein C5S48_04165 [ANME-2 cluster archaeon]
MIEQFIYSWKVQAYGWRNSSGSIGGVSIGIAGSVYHKRSKSKVNL